LCYRSLVMGSPDKVAGFALGALLDGDRDASRIRAQITEPFHTAVAARLAAIGASADKREALSALIRHVRPERAISNDLPTAARALLERAARGKGATQDCPDLVAMLRRLSNLASSRGAP